MRRIGIDVGGTNTDAVVIEDGQIAVAVKAPTSEDVTSGILDAFGRLKATGGLSGERIDAVMIGTTHFMNAVVQRRHLTKVGALRLGMPASASLPPFCDWPPDLARLVEGGVWMVEGGHEYYGRPPSRPSSRLSIPAMDARPRPSSRKRTRVRPSPAPATSGASACSNAKT